MPSAATRWSGARRGSAPIAQAQRFSHCHARGASEFSVQAPTGQAGTDLRGSLRSLDARKNDNCVPAELAGEPRPRSATNVAARKQRRGVEARAPEEASEQVVLIGGDLSG